MFNEKIQSQVVGQLKIFDKDSGEVLVQKKNAIHPGNMAYVMASALAGKPVDVNSGGGAPSINWMQFGNGGSNSTTTLSYRSPRVFPTYEGLAITASNSALYSPTYEQETVETVYYPGQDLGGGVFVPNNTSKINFKVDLSHNDYESMLQLSDPTVSTPETDSSTDTNSVQAFTFDEIGLIAGVTDNNLLDKTKSLMLTHVTFHPVLLSANRTIVIDYTITIQIS